MKRSLNYFKNSKAWIERHRNDIYVKMSVKNDLRSRAIFKLEEIQEKYKLIQSSNIVLGISSSSSYDDCYSNSPSSFFLLSLLF